MEKTVVFLYKCRRCERIDRSLEAAEKNGHTGLIEAIIGYSLDPSKGFPITLFHTHSCADGGMGISDLIGYEVKKG
jgi:hypothetical protein